MLVIIIILRSSFVGQDPEKSSQMCQDFPSFYTRPLEAKTPVNGDTILPSLHLPGELSSLYTYVFILCLLIALKATKTLKWLLYFGVLKSLFSHHPLPAVYLLFYYCINYLPTTALPQNSAIAISGLVKLGRKECTIHPRSSMIYLLFV